ncbi:hypothetical protein ACOMHN_026062 [Nucella lapillus]
MATASFRAAVSYPQLAAKGHADLRRHLPTPRGRPLTSSLPRFGVPALPSLLDSLRLDFGHRASASAKGGSPG